MGKITSAQRAHLEAKFGARVSFDPAECFLYGHDATLLPPRVRRALGDTVPEAVVQPQSEAELSDLAAWAAAAEMASRLATASRQPRPPHPQRGPSGMTCM